MKLQLAVATVALALTGAAFADPSASDSATKSNTVDTTYAYAFDYNATAPAVTPQFVTNVTNTTAGAVNKNTPLAFTHFKAPAGTSATYKLEASYSANDSEYTSYFNTSASVGTDGYIYANSVNAGDDLYIVLATAGTTLTAGSTHVTYTITNYKA
ncbi:hypothetical protein CB343_003555 [Salmonella enterica subsp. diarizonae]|nr:hypothetical protein [Salmonella enterica subsp. diarizonae]